MGTAKKCTRACCPLRLHVTAVIVLHGTRMPAGAAQFTDIGAAGLVAIDGRIGHASERKVFQIRKVFE